MSDRDEKFFRLGAGELALQTILVCLCKELTRSSPELDRCIRDGFDNAANRVENVAIQLGERAPPELTIEALRVIEQLRAGVFSR